MSLNGRKKIIIVLLLSFKRTCIQAHKNQSSKIWKSWSSTFGLRTSARPVALKAIPVVLLELQEQAVHHRRNWFQDLETQRVVCPRVEDLETSYCRLPAKVPHPAELAETEMWKNLLGVASRLFGHLEKTVVNLLLNVQCFWRNLQLTFQFRCSEAPSHFAIRTQHIAVNQSINQ